MRFGTFPAFTRAPLTTTIEQTDFMAGCQFPEVWFERAESVDASTTMNGMDPQTDGCSVPRIATASRPNSGQAVPPSPSGSTTSGLIQRLLSPIPPILSRPPTTGRTACRDLENRPGVAPHGDNRTTCQPKSIDSPSRCRTTSPPPTSSARDRTECGDSINALNPICSWTSP